MTKGFLNTYRVLLLILLLSLVSCSKEQLIDSTNTTVDVPVEMRLQVDGSLGSSVSGNENVVRRLRMVIFGSATSPDARKLIMNKYYATVPEGNILKEFITSGRRDIYIIANEPLSGANQELDSYKNIATVADIYNLSLSYQATASLDIYNPSEIPMFLEQLNQNVKFDVINNEISGEIKRTMAKVTINLNVKHANFPSGKHVVIKDVIIKNLPERSFLIAKAYVGNLVNSEKQNVKVITTESGYNFSSNNTFYVPEYIMSSNINGAYIEITGHINNDPTKITKWGVLLGDAMDDGKRYGDRFDITRNHHYNFTGDIKSYGQVDDLSVKITVLPWNTVDMSEDVGSYISFSKVTNETNQVIDDGSNLDDMGQTIKISCNTNIGGWYTVTKNAKGFIVHKSTSTAAVSAVTAQTVSIVIPKIANSSSQQSYTVNIYHPTVAQESVGPVKSLSFTQGGGSI